MEKDIRAYYEKERKKIVNECIKCGLCIDECQVVKKNDFSVDYKSLQKK